MKLIESIFLGFLLLHVQVQGSSDENINLLMFKHWYGGESAQLLTKIDNYGKSLQILTENFKNFMISTIMKPLSYRTTKISHFYMNINRNHDSSKLKKKLDSFVDQFTSLQNKYYPEYQESYKKVITYIGTHCEDTLLEMRGLATSDSTWETCISKYKKEFLSIVSGIVKMMDNCIIASSNNLNTLKTANTNNMATFTSFAQNIFVPLEKCMVQRDGKCVDDVFSKALNQYEIAAAPSKRLYDNFNVDPSKVCQDVSLKSFKDRLMFFKPKANRCLQNLEL